MPTGSFRRAFGSILAAAIGALAVLMPASGIGVADAADAEDPLRPKRHFDLQRPASLTAAEAMTIYDGITAEMAAGYAISQDPTALRFRQWKRFNTAPYKSATHGNRYVNNYANGIAAPSYEAGEEMPEGAVLAKDSFTVTSDAAVFAGAPFVMEKRPARTRPETGDWRYVMIMPDGSYFGDSEGDNAEAVAFCHDCHASEEATDFLFFVPEKYRMPSAGN